MEEHLRDLKRNMDKTVFHNISFDRNKSINSVLMDQKKNRTIWKGIPIIRLKHRIMDVLGIIVCVGILFLIINNHTFNGLQGKNTSQPKQESTKKTLSQGTVYIPPKQKENFKEMTKEEILTKMFDTVNNFETAKGEFKLHYADTTVDTLVEYELSLNNRTGGYSKTINNYNGTEEVNYGYYNDGTMWNLNEKTHTFKEMKYLEGTNSKNLPNDRYFTVGNDGVIFVIKNGGKPPIGLPQESLFPYEIAANYTKNLNTWEIEKQNEELLGHNTVVITGKINHRTSKTFRFWVDKDTGILVKYETYNSAGNVEDYLHPTNLEINVPIDSKRFIPNLNGYTNLRTIKQPTMTTGNIDQLIPDSLKSQWEEAKKKTNETTILHQDDKWYIFAKKGYLVDRIETNGNEGTLYLAKATPQKSQFTFHGFADGYKVDSLKIIYE